MNKGEMASSSGMSTAGGGPVPSAPPSAPPSYEEAVGLTTNQTVIATPAVSGAPPYPVAGVQMPMPSPYAPPIAQVSFPTQTISSVNQTQRPEIRVVHQHVTLALGPNPIKMTCPSCHADIKTTTMSDHQPSAHVCCIILCLIGCCLCSCLPYCFSAFLSVHHVCPNCKAYIGTWKG